MRTVKNLVSDMRTGVSVLRSNTEYRLRSMLRSSPFKAASALFAKAGAAIRLIPIMIMRLRGKVCP